MSFRLLIPVVLLGLASCSPAVTSNTAKLSPID